MDAFEQSREDFAYHYHSLVDMSEDDDGESEYHSDADDLYDRWRDAQMEEE